MLPLTRIRIAGPSMEPTLRNGDWWLVRRTSALGPGEVAVLVHPERPHVLIVKRLVRREPTGWWVEGDNPRASEDSRAFGLVPEANLVGRVTLRYHPLVRRS